MKFFPQKANAAAATYSYEAHVPNATDAVFIRQNKYLLPAVIVLGVGLLATLFLMYVQSSVGKTANANDLNALRIEAMEKEIGELAAAMESQRDMLTNEINRVEDAHNADNREILKLLQTFETNFKQVQIKLDNIAASNISSIQKGGKKKVK